MKRVGNGFIKKFCYLCLVGVIALAFTTIVGIGSGGADNATHPRHNFTRGKIALASPKQENKAGILTQVEILPRWPTL